MVPSPEKENLMLDKQTHTLTPNPLVVIVVACPVRNTQAMQWAANGIKTQLPKFH